MAQTFEHHYRTILNYFDNRSTNDLAEPFKRAVAPYLSKSF
ncbi:hypothetical protein [Arcticibacterium luteifluviistationis]